MCGNRFSRTFAFSIAAKIPPGFVAFLPFIAGGCSDEWPTAAKAFSSDPARHAAGTGREPALATDQVNERVRLRGREGKSVAAYLNEVRNQRSD